MKKVNISNASRQWRTNPSETDFGRRSWHIITALDLYQIISVAPNLIAQAYNGDVIDFVTKCSFLVWQVYHEVHKMVLSWFPLPSMSFCQYQFTNYHGLHEDYSYQYRWQYGTLPLTTPSYNLTFVLVHQYIFDIIS